MSVVQTLSANETYAKVRAKPERERMSEVSMSRHSKWSKIKRQKGASDVAKGKVFTKLARAITVAVREKGGDPSVNFSLRLAMDKAREANMPKENVERAIKRGTGEIAGEVISEVTYEAYLPGGTAIIITTLTDNKNRTTSNIKHIITNRGGSLGAQGSVMWAFDKKYWESGEVEFIPKNLIQIEDADTNAKIEEIFDALDEDEDVNDFFTNIE